MPHGVTALASALKGCPPTTLAHYHTAIAVDSTTSRSRRPWLSTACGSRRTWSASLPTSAHSSRRVSVVAGALCGRSTEYRAHHSIFSIRLLACRPSSPRVAIAASMLTCLRQGPLQVTAQVHAICQNLRYKAHTKATTVTVI